MPLRADSWPEIDGTPCVDHPNRALQFVLILSVGIGGVAWTAEKPPFTDITETSGIARLVDDHYASYPKWWLNGLHMVDLDGDGDIDLLAEWGHYSSPDGNCRIYCNDLPARNWLRIQLIGSRGNRGVAGAKIRIYTHDEGRLLWYEQVTIYDSQAAASYYALPVTERHFGLGKRKTIDVSVEFYPSHRLIWRRGVTANRAVEITEQPASQ